MNSKNVGRNDPCPCGSGKKYKQCCQDATASQSDAALKRLLGNVPELFAKALKLQEANELEQAEKIYQMILTAAPKHADTLYQLGLLMIKIGRFQESLALLQKATKFEPSATNYCALSRAFQALQQNDDALACLFKAIELNPGDSIAYNNIGAHLLREKQHQRAVTHLQKSISLNSANDSAWANLGLSCMHRGNYKDAIGYIKKAIAINPSQAHYNNLLFCLCFERDAFLSNYLDEAHCLDILLTEKATPFQQWPVTTLPTSPLRVGLVSGDFKAHPVGYFLESIITQLNTANIALIAYSTHSHEDALTARLKPYFHQWFTIYALNDKQTAQQIHADNIHILIDLSGYTSGNRLPVFTWRPAPVQISWLGYFASTGLQCMDYFLADPISAPKSVSSQFTEKVWHLPHTRLCFTPPAADIAQELTSLPANKNGFITFGCFQNLDKLSDSIMMLWGEILENCPNSKLMLKNMALKDTEAKQTLISRFETLNIPIERVILEEGSSRELYLAAYGNVDFMLDTFPFPGGTTTCEALWMGVPTLTLTGNTLLERQGMAILNCVGLTDWIANDGTDYIQKAIYFANNTHLLCQIRANLRQTMATSPLVDAAQFALDFEQALLAMWKEKTQL